MRHDCNLPYWANVLREKVHDYVILYAGIPQRLCLVNYSTFYPKILNSP